MNSTAHPSRINPPGGRRTGALILKGGAYQASSLCLYGTDTTYPWKALLKPCGDLQGQPSCHMWLAQVPVHDSSGRRGATSTLPAQQGAMPSAGASRGIFQGLPYLLKTQLVSVVSKQPSASPEPASFEQRDPRAEAVPMGRVSPIYVLTRREGRRGAWQRTREGSAVSAHPGGHTHRHSACNAEPEETTSPKAACVRCLGRLVAKGMCSACDKLRHAVCHQCYLKANETGINNCAVESLSVAPCLSLTIYIS